MGEILEWMNRPHDKFIAVVALTSIGIVIAIAIAAYRRG
jgi:pheromone shutdown protein TraB